MSAQSRTRVHLTSHALDALADIFAYSKSQWGRQTAERYLDELEAGLERIRLQPDLVRALPELHAAFGFYRVNQHLLVCDVRRSSIVVLTIVHASLDIPSRLAELEPGLAAEVALLHRSLENRKRFR